MVMIQSQKFASKSPNRPPLGRLIIRRKDVSSLRQLDISEIHLIINKLT